MLKVFKNFALMEEEGKLINLTEIAYINTYYSANSRKYLLDITFKQMDGFEIPYDSLAEAEARLHDIYKAIGVMK